MRSRNDSPARRAWRSRREVVAGLALPFVAAIAGPARAAPSCDEASAPPAPCHGCRFEVRLEAREPYRQCFAAMGTGVACELCGHARALHVSLGRDKK